MSIRPRAHPKRWSISALLCFEVVFHCLLVALVVPVYQALVELTLTTLNIPILGWKELRLLPSAPMALLAQLAALFLLLFCLYWDLAALVFYCDRSHQGQRLSIWGLWKGSFLAALPVLHWRRIALLLMLPLSFFSLCPLAIRLAQPLRIPTLILDLILAWPIPLWGAIALPVLLLGLLLVCFLGLPAVILDRKGFLTAWKTGLMLLRQRFIPTVRRCMAALLAFLGGGFALTAIAVALLAALMRLLYAPEAARYLFRSALLYWFPAWGLLLLLLLALLLTAAAVSLYRQYCKPAATPAAAAPMHFDRLRTALSLVCSATLLVFLTVSGLGDTLRPALPVTSTVVAHRGASAVAPENSLSALEAAIDLRADMAEIDIRQTKDMAFVVIHDARCERVAGEDLKVSNTLLKDLRQLEVGASFSPQYDGEPIPTLREALACAKDRITLMIEIKSTGRNQEHRLLSLIRQYGMLSQCILASKDLETLENLKELDPAVQTVYIAPYLSPGDYALDYVDGYSVRLTSLSREMAVRLRAQGKPIYGWTANTPLDIRRLLLCNVDGIVTDDVPLAKAALARQAQPALADRLTNWFFPAK